MRNNTRMNHRLKQESSTEKTMAQLLHFMLVITPCCLWFDDELMATWDEDVNVAWPTETTLKGIILKQKGWWYIFVFCFHFVFFLVFSDLFKACFLFFGLLMFFFCFLSAFGFLSAFDFSWHPKDGWGCSWWRGRKSTNRRCQRSLSKRFMPQLLGPGEWKWNGMWSAGIVTLCFQKRMFLCLLPKTLSWQCRFAPGWRRSLSHLCWSDRVSVCVRGSAIIRSHRVNYQRLT